jgi:hypothetical protein
MHLPDHPAPVAVFADHGHSVGVVLLAISSRRRLGSLREQPRHLAGAEDIVAIPSPRVGGQPRRVTVEEAPQLVVSSKQRLFGCNHDYFGVQRQKAHDPVTVPVLERPTEGVENGDQGFLRHPPQYLAVGALQS